MRVPIYEVDTTLKGDGKTKRLGWFTEENGRIVADPLSPVMANILNLNVITMVGGKLVNYNAQDHPTLWLKYLNHAARGYIFAGPAERTPEERKEETTDG